MDERRVTRCILRSWFEFDSPSQSGTTSDLGYSDESDSVMDVFDEVVWS